MKSILLSVLLPGFLFAQRAVTVSYAQDAKGNYVFTATNSGFCPYSLFVNFSMLQNAHTDQPMPFIQQIDPGVHRIFSVIKDNAESIPAFKYKVQSSKGCLHPLPDSSFVYLLPIVTGREVQAYLISNSNQKQEANNAFQNAYTIRLKMGSGDTIYAARRGTVVEVVDQFGANDAGRSSIGEENYVEVYQADCSFAHYAILKKGTALVKPGQIIEAGSPLGLVGGDQYGRGSDARFSVSFRSDQADTAVSAERKGDLVFIEPYFWVKDAGKIHLKNGSSYVAERPAAILKQELKKPGPARKKTKK